MNISELKEHLESIPGVELLTDADIEILTNKIINDIKANDPK